MPAAGSFTEVAEMCFTLPHQHIAKLADASGVEAEIPFGDLIDEMLQLAAQMPKPGTGSYRVGHRVYPLRDHLIKLSPGAQLDELKCLVMAETVELFGYVALAVEVSDPSLLLRWMIENLLPAVVAKRHHDDIYFDWDDGTVIQAE